MKIIRTIGEMRRALAASPSAVIGLVPTMGALHAGHVALLRAARRECEIVVASLFVNPTQFNDPADLVAYPRNEGEDESVARDAGTDFLFAPSVEEMYRTGHGTWVVPEGAADGLEGAVRPGHFRGVATVCLKLFLIVRPRLAYFGQKDAQQVAVIEQMVRDLDVDLEIRVVPTVRESDGLALSSRNVRLSPADRSRAAVVPKALHAGVAASRAGRDPAAAARAVLDGLPIDYVTVAELAGHPTLAVAVRLSGTRLIDNVRLDDDAAAIDLMNRTSGGRTAQLQESIHGE